GNSRHAGLRSAAALGGRRAAAIPAGARACPAVLPDSRRDLRPDPAVRPIQPAQAHAARRTVGHADGAQPRIDPLPDSRTLARLTPPLGPPAIPDYQANARLN